MFPTHFPPHLPKNAFLNHYLTSNFLLLFTDPRTLIRAASSDADQHQNRSVENSAAASAFRGHQRPPSASGIGEVCPSCREPFDCGKKRRLIDSCGHERCYTCMFSKELCSLCTIEGKKATKLRRFNSQNGTFTDRK